jgi:hypothetical protein
MESLNLKKYMPYIWIIVGFAIVSFLYCYPQLQGKKLNQHDGISWVGASHEAVSYKDSTGISPLWSNSMFGGMPTYTSYLTGIKDYVQPIQSLVSAVIPDPAFLFFLAMVGFFVLACSLGFNIWIGAIGAIAYAFATYNPVIISAGHVTKMISLGHLPGVLAGFLMIFNGRRLTGAAVMGLFFTLMISVSHYQIVYYTALLLLIAGIGIAINEFKNGRAKNLIIGTVIAAVVGVLSLLPSLPNILPTAEYTKYTMRGGASELKLNKESETKKSGGLDKDYAFKWSNGIGETFCLIVPQLYGGASAQDIGSSSNFYKAMTNAGFPEQNAEQYAAQAPTYWGPQPFLSGPVYFGAIICFLFVLGMAIVRSPYKWWILAASILAIMMSWGNHFEAFNYFLFDHLPMYNKFRAPSMVLVIPQLLFPILGIWALNDIFTKKIEGEELWKKIKLSAIITGGLCLLLAIGGQMFFDFKGSGDAEMAAQFSKAANNPQIGQQIIKALQDDRAALAMKSGLMSAFFIAAAAALLWAFSKNKLKKEMAIGGLALLVLFDMLPTASKYLNEKNYVDSSDYDAQLAPRPVDEAIMKDKDPYYRVLDLTRNTYNDAVQAYFHKCVGGYSAAKMESYQDLIDVYLSKGFNTQVLDMLNTKYIIFNGGANGQASFQPNTDACGNAWFVNEIKYVNSANEEMTAMKAKDLGDTAHIINEWKALQTAVIRKDFAPQLGNSSNFIKDSAANVKLDKYGLNEISFVSSNKNEGLAVFSDIYYDKGWKAYVDGKETPIVKANYVLRALKLPAGNHKIEFKFHPDSYYKSNNLAMISSILLYLLFGAAIFMAFKKKEETPPSAN